MFPRLLANACMLVMFLWVLVYETEMDTRAPAIKSKS